MKGLILYRIVSYILLIVACPIAFMVFGSLLAALMNPILLLPVFILTCIVLYSYCSWRFLTRGIDNQMVCKKSLKDLIKVNGYTVIFFGFLNIIQSVTILNNPQLMQQALDQVTQMQGAAGTNFAEYAPALFKGLFKFLLVYSILLIGHTFFSFRLVKLFGHLFE